MNRREINFFIDSFKNKKNRTIVIIDYGNLEKWKKSLKWIIGIKELAQLIKNFSFGNKGLRRFYYGEDYGSKEKSLILSEWSRAILEKAEYNRFERCSKRVKYIHDKDRASGFDKKCDLDVEMTIDLVKLRDSYDTILLFSGDGDLMYAIEYLHNEYGKECYIFGARDHIGREVFDAKIGGILKDIIFIEDFEFRLNRDRFKNRAY
jgi:uncharacterized LabA/DUF88 family protein